MTAIGFNSREEHQKEARHREVMPALSPLSLLTEMERSSRSSHEACEAAKLVSLSRLEEEEEWQIVFSARPAVRTGDHRAFRGEIVPDRHKNNLPDTEATTNLPPPCLIRRTKAKSFRSRHLTHLKSSSNT